MEYYDKEYAKEVFNRTKDKGGYKLFFKDLKIIGENNLKRNGKQRLYIGNHLSHADYICAWHMFHEYNSKMPMIPAGKNLDLKILNKMGIDFGRLGAFWIDRTKVNTKERKEICELSEKIKEILNNNNDMLVFPESGRSYNGNLFEKYKTGIIKKILLERNDLEIVPMAFDYSKRVEEDFFKKMEKVKDLGRIGNFLYLTLDATAFIKSYLKKNKETAFINIGKGYSLEEISKDKQDIPQTIKKLKEFSISKINKLYEEIQVIKKQ